MANYKIVSDIDLSGNKLIDVVEITRSAYNKAVPGLDLAIKAGSDLASVPDNPGGSLKLYSGAGQGVLANGNIELIHPDHNIILSDVGLAITLTDANIVTNTGTGTIDITSGLFTIINDFTVKGNTTLGDGTGNDLVSIISDLKLFKDDASTEILFIDNSALTLDYIGTVYQNTTGYTSSDDLYKIDVDASNIFNINGIGDVYLKGNLQSDGATISFPGTTSFIIGTDDAVARLLNSFMNIEVGSTTNTKTLKTFGDITISNVTTLDEAYLKTDKSTGYIFNDTVTTIYAFESATSISIGNASGTTTINGNFQVEGITDYLLFNPSYTESGLSEGALFYSNKELLYKNEIGNISLGKDIKIRVRNESGSTITKGSLVYTSGISNDLPLIELAGANSALTSEVIGIVDSDIATASEGYVLKQGVISGIDTSSFSNGDLLYLSNSTLGAFSTISSSDPNYGTIIGKVLKSDVNSGIILINIHDWAQNTFHNSIKTKEIIITDKLYIPDSVNDHLVYLEADNASSDYWLTYNNGTEDYILIDDHHTQAITNKTYNGLGITTTSTATTLSASSNSLSQIFEGNVTFYKDFTLQDGDLIIKASSSNSTVSFPTGTLDFSGLDTSDANQKALVIASGVVAVGGLGVSQNGDLIVDGYIQVHGDYKTDSTTYNILPDTVTTLTIADQTPNISIGVNSATANVFEIGNALNTSVVSFNSTKDSTNYDNGAVVIDGGVGIAKNIYTNASLHLQNNSNTNPLTFNDIDFYRSNANEMTLESDFIVKDIYSSNITFKLAINTVTTMNMLEEASAILNVGSDITNTRKMNLYGDLQVGSTTNNKDITVWGNVNVGGDSGISIQYDAGDDSLNFVKL